MPPFRHDAKPASGPVRPALVVGPETMRHLGRVVKQLTIGLLDEPMRIVLAAPESVDLSALPCPPVEIVRYRPPRVGRFHRRAIESLADQLAQRNVELLHALDGSAHALTRRLSDQTGLPYFLSVNDLRAAENLASVGEHCRAILPASTSLREALRAAGVIPAKGIHVIRPGVHPTGRPDCFSHPERSAAVIAAGDFDDRRLGDALLGSFAAVRAAGHDCVYFILSAGKAEHRLRAAAQTLKLTADLTFVDRIAHVELPGVLKAADALIFGHTSGRVETEILEAMGAGAAVLAGGRLVGDFAIDGRTVIECDPLSQDDLTAKLLMFLNEPSTARRLAESALEFVQARHSPASMVAAVADLYREYALRGRMLTM